MKRIFLILFLFWILPTYGQTYFGTASSPADNGTSATSPVSVTPPGSMVAGDLVIAILYARNASATFGISNTGGQTWTSHSSHQGTTATLTTGVYYCIYNGTWSANPSFTFSSTTNTNVVLQVFRPTAGSSTWGVETASGNTDILLHSNVSNTTSNASFFNFTTTNNKVVCLAIFTADDDNTWGSLSGSGWAIAGGAQYRNTSGNDVSSSYAYNVKATAGLTQTCSQIQSTADGNIAGIVLFYEIAAGVPNPRRIINISLNQNKVYEKMDFLSGITCQ